MHRRTVYVRSEPGSGRLEPFRGEWGASIVSSGDRRVIVRAALAAVLVSAVGLSACGRKGPLEPPPSAAATPADGSGESPQDAGKSDAPFILDGLL